MRVETDERGLTSIVELTTEQVELIQTAALAQAEKRARKASYSNFLRRLAMELDKIIIKIGICKNDGTNNKQ